MIFMSLIFTWEAPVENKKGGAEEAIGGHDGGKGHDGGSASLIQLEGKRLDSNSSLGARNTRRVGKIPRWAFGRGTKNLVPGGRRRELELTTGTCRLQWPLTRQKRECCKKGAKNRWKSRRDNDKAWGKDGHVRRKTESKVFIPSRL